MTFHNQRSLDGKLAIRQDYVWEHKIRGEKEQRERVWKNFEHSNGEWYCVICDKQIARGVPTRSGDLARGELHHPIKRRYFPSPYEVNQDEYSLEELQSQHHVSNGIIVCTSCHGAFEGFENGRPHLMSWLCKEVTGQEAPLVLPSSSHLLSQQRRDWIYTQREVERSYDFECTACGQTQSKEVEKTIYIDAEKTVSYIGRNVRTVHVIPPVTAPELMHHPANLLLLCLDCLFGTAEEGAGDNPTKSNRWIDQPAMKWTRRFAPHLLRDYEGRLLL